MSISVWHVFWVALLTDLATGLGVIPLAFVRKMNDRWRGIFSATAGGMMISAAVFSLVDEALHRGRGASFYTVAGMVAGAAFLTFTGKQLERYDWRIGSLNAADSRKALLVLIAMFLHSIPEGVAVGVGYGTGEYGFGILLALVIAVHNIPEGTAVALPLRARGVSLPACVGYAILTSVPQPLFAVPSFLLVSAFERLLPAGLGFAGGAMIYIVAKELLPEGYECCTHEEVAWSVLVGLLLMLVLTAALKL